MTNQTETEQEKTPEQPPLFFWLGAEGDLEEVTEEKFCEKVKNEQEAQRKWKEVDLGE